MDYEREILDALGAAGERLVVPQMWEGIPGTAFGGFAVASMFAAASTQASLPRPLSVHARFHRPVPIGQPVGVRVELERRGRMLEVFRVSLCDAADGQRLLVAASVAFGDRTSVTMRSLAVAPMAPLVDPMPVAEAVRALGIPVPPMMAHVGFRRPRAMAAPTGAPVSGDWHLHADWPAPRAPSPRGRAIGAIMCADAFVAPATMLANGFEPSEPWPAILPSVDVATWFHELAPPAEDPSGYPWLNVRASVPATGGGIALGRTQIWHTDQLLAEGMSQVLLLPAP